MPTLIRLLLADDHALVREGLKHLFSVTTDIIVADEATNGAQVLNILQNEQSERFDLVLLDLTMPGIAGPDLISQIQTLELPPPILVLSMHNDPQVARRALVAGANGYLTKDNNPDVLLGAIRKIASGGRYLDPVLAETMAFEATVPACRRPVHESLSDRELQVFSLLVKGLTVNDIAAQLAISNKTISTHKSRLMDKMGLVNNTDLIRYALSHEMTD